MVLALSTVISDFVVGAFQNIVTVIRQLLLLDISSTDGFCRINRHLFSNMSRRKPNYVNFPLLLASPSDIILLMPTAQHGTNPLLIENVAGCQNIVYIVAGTLANVTTRRQTPEGYTHLT